MLAPVRICVALPPSTRLPPVPPASPPSVRLPSKPVPAGTSIPVVAPVRVRACPPSATVPAPYSADAVMPLLAPEISNVPSTTICGALASCPLPESASIAPAMTSTLPASITPPLVTCELPPIATCPGVVIVPASVPALSDAMLTLELVP
ncbi:hypothetical protein GLUCOINTEAF2_0203018 [Komagataeibacter intermedius AF2]|uniref:Uncharacterized protein n=1 Tax=Komagataeibacter intermedius AF2 TaxID=1458464 RepID=A0A0N1F8I4_9PROT|nr:hypothetical protein GLUCOINTEAF2_0203018 [Komagataeibacter intermedius AF2]